MKMAKLYTGEEAKYSLEIADPPKPDSGSGIYSNLRVSHGSMNSFKESHVNGLTPMEITDLLLEKWDDQLAEYDSDCEVKLLRSRWYVTRRGSRTKHIDREVIFSVKLSETERYQQLLQKA
jgi:hypothetical protein